MEPKGVNLRGPCPNCETPLATDQRYCTSCGERLGPALSLPYGAVPTWQATRFGLPMPLRLASTLVASTLVFGVVVGTAMSTALSEHPSPPPPMLAQAPPPKEPKEKAVAPAPTPAPTPAPPVASGITSPYAPGVQIPSTSIKPAKPRPQILSGTVVHVNRAAGSYALAPGGPLVAIHTAKLPTPGTRVRTPVRTLLNGTYAEAGKRKTRGRTDKATFSGTVTFRDDEAGKDYYTVSGTGTSVLVHVPPDASGAATPPEFATSVTVSVHFDQPGSSAAGPAQGAPPPAQTSTTPQPTSNACDSNGEATPATPKVGPDVKLTQTSRTVSQSGVTTSGMEGIVQAVCPGSSQLVLSADDMRESDQDTVLAVARGIDLRKVAVGAPITASVELKPPDLLSLGSLAGDQGIKGANNQSQVQTGSSSTTSP